MFASVFIRVLLLILMDEPGRSGPHATAPECDAFWQRTLIDARDAVIISDPDPPASGQGENIFFILNNLHSDPFEGGG